MTWFRLHALISSKQWQKIGQRLYRPRKSRYTKLTTTDKTLLPVPCHTSADFYMKINKDGEIIFSKVINGLEYINSKNITS